MAFSLPQLPWAKDALAPHMSAETIEYHYGKHHLAYINKANELIAGTPNEGKSLEELIMSTSGVLFNQVAQVWNHTFFWHCLSPNGGGAPTGKLGEAIDAQFGSFAKFKEEFSKAAIGQFGSGWAWLSKDGQGKLVIHSTSNAGTPMTEGKTALLTLDVWEHAYYVDHRNARPKFVETFWNLVNWDFVAKNLG